MKTAVTKKGKEVVQLGFYSHIEIECVNKNKFYPWPTPDDLDCAELVARHGVLTSIQLQELGYSSRRLGKLVKKGVLYRYKVKTPDGSLPSIFTTGYTAQVIARLPVPRFPDLNELRNLLIINQIIVSILLKTEARVNIDIGRPVQIVTVNNPFGVMVVRDMFYPKLLHRYGLKQAIAVLPNEKFALPGMPFRYVLEEELEHDSFDIKYYYRNQKELVPVDITFKKRENDAEATVSGSS